MYNFREMMKNPHYKKFLNSSAVRRMFRDVAEGKADK
jgi:hypothetical protein